MWRAGCAKGKDCGGGGRRGIRDSGNCNVGYSEVFYSSFFFFVGGLGLLRKLYGLHSVHISCIFTRG